MNIRQRNLSNTQKILINFANSWQERFGMEYDIEWAGEMPFAVRLSNMDITPDKLQEKMRLYFDDPKWWELSKCSFRAFVNNIGKFVPEPHRAKAEPVDPWIQCSGCGEVHRASEGCKIDPDVEVRPLGEALDELSKKMRI